MLHCCGLENLGSSSVEMFTWFVWSGTSPVRVSSASFDAGAQLGLPASRVEGGVIDLIV